MESIRPVHGGNGQNSSPRGGNLPPDRGRQITNGRQIAAPTVSRIVENLKRIVSMKSGVSPWQKSFHDHITRNETDHFW
jgi:hypothetical protein